MISRAEPKAQRHSVQSTWLDRLIGVFSPSAAFKRLAYRKAAVTLTSYAAAEQDRVNKNWSTSTGDADADILTDMPTIRERVREMVRNNAIVSGYATRRVTNVVGTGITPQSTPDIDELGITPEKAEEFQRVAERIWRRWTPDADFYGEMNFTEILRLVERQLIECGEALVLRSFDGNPRRQYGLALQVVEPDRLESPNFRDTDTIRGGVERDAQGRVIAYHITEAHPGDKTPGKKSAMKYIRVPAYDADGRRNVYHIKHVLRPGQSRGISILASAILKLRSIDKFDEAELVRARIAACFAAFIKSPDTYNQAVGRADDTDSDSKGVETFEPGMIEYLDPGQDIVVANPQYPGGGYDAYMLRNLRTVAAGLGISYEGLTADFSESTYSSARSAILEDRALYHVFQMFLIEKLCQPVWGLLLEEAFLKGDLPMVRNFYGAVQAWCQARWITPGWSWVDPSNEVEAEVTAVDNGFRTLADVCASQGADWEEILRQKSREKKLAESLGLELGTIARQVVDKGDSGKEKRNAGNNKKD
jgi:lambda family phage portal protein